MIILNGRRQIASLDREIADIGLAVSQALSPANPRPLDIKDVAFRLGKMEDAVAGLRVNQHGVVTRMVTFVCFAIGSKPSELISFRRSKHLAHGRFAIMWAARELTPHSYTMIAHALGGFDHSSIIHGCRRADELREIDPDFRALTDALIEHFTPTPNQEHAPCLPL